MLDEKKKVADRYLKRQVLGEGTYGVVYKAFDTMAGKRRVRELILLSLNLWVAFGFDWEF
ncbi:hypothetical protein CK203_044015 [Vitis vinifera]|uniref:Protein kinase domain-containing protein n=1 Tax=Vitis vinifera TaxID=29760 RepID=A0A438HTN5_VITVI|nr:hypothetical protein CK203_116783 [Vitis vinifera]RVW87750.1 hypothetical protein CK203_044015 [Vitis vinifera]